MPEHVMTIVRDGQAIRCDLCGKTSWSHGDIEHGYCGNCHAYAEEVRGRPPTREARPWKSQDLGMFPPKKPTKTDRRIDLLMEE